MGTSHQRDLYFNKYIKNQPTPASYLKALLTSPYRTHQRMGQLLQRQYEAMLKEQHNQEVRPIPQEDLFFKQEDNK